MESTMLNAHPWSEMRMRVDKARQDIVLTFNMFKHLSQGEAACTIPC